MIKHKAFFLSALVQLLRKSHNLSNTLSTRQNHKFIFNPPHPETSKKISKLVGSAEDWFMFGAHSKCSEKEASEPRIVHVFGYVIHSSYGHNKLII